VVSRVAPIIPIQCTSGTVPQIPNHWILNEPPITLEWHSSVRLIKSTESIDALWQASDPRIEKVRLRSATAQHTYVAFRRTRFFDSCLLLDLEHHMDHMALCTPIRTTFTARGCAWRMMGLSLTTYSPSRSYLKP
jgi:hypothetical protein